MQKDLTKTIAASLSDNKADLNLKTWAKYIIEHKIPILDLIGLIHAEKPVATRFAWMLGGMCETAPDHVYPSITYFFSKRKEIKVLNFDRSIAKMFHLAGVPPEIEGEAVDFLFKLLLDPRSNVQTKSTALNALHKLADKHLGLKNELKISINEELGKNSVSFEKRARKILGTL